MNIRYLEILEAIEQTKSFTGAAKKLHLTQSAVSHAVAELEEQAGTPLFQRLPRGVEPTRCGRTLLEESRELLAASRKLDQKINHLEDLTTIQIASSITIASFWLPSVLRELKRSYPDLHVQVRVVSAHAAMDLLKTGEADIAFWEGADSFESFQVISLGTYRLAAACAPDYPISDHPVPLSLLCRHPLLLRECGSAVRDTFDHTLSLAGLKASPVWESVNSFSLMKAAGAGLGVTILPEALLSDSLRQHKLRRIHLENVSMENHMLAILRKEQYITRPLQILLDYIRSDKED